MFEIIYQPQFSHDKNLTFELWCVHFLVPLYMLQFQSQFANKQTVVTYRINLAQNEVFYELDADHAVIDGNSKAI